MKKILIIDDEKDLCLLLKHFFVSRKHKVAISHAIKEGMQCAEEFEPDIIFLDNNMPDGNGWEKAEWFAKTLPETNIVLISAFKHNELPKFNNPKISIMEKPLSLLQLAKEF